MGNTSLYEDRRLVIEFSHKTKKEIKKIIKELDGHWCYHGEIGYNSSTDRYRVRVCRLDDVFYILSTVCSQYEDTQGIKAEKARAALSLAKFLFATKGGN